MFYRKEKQYRWNRFFDASTSRADACEISVNDNWEKVTDLLMSMKPSELIFSEKLSQDAKFRHCISHLEKTIFSQHNSQQKVVEKSLKELLKVSDLGHIDLNESEAATHAIALAAHYLSRMHQMTEIPLNKISIINNHQYMTIDRTTLANLQLIHAHSGEKEGSLFGSIDKCRTAMGRRKLKQWILNPLMDINEIVLETKFDKITYKILQKVNRNKRHVPGTERHGETFNSTGIWESRWQRTLCHWRST